MNEAEGRGRGRLTATPVQLQGGRFMFGSSVTGAQPALSDGSRLPLFTLGGGEKLQGSRVQAAQRQVMAAHTAEDTSPAYLIQVTPIKDKSVSFYVSLAKRALLVNENLELSGIGTAMATTVNISEVLHNSGVATRSRVCTSMAMFQQAAVAAPKSADGFGRLSVGAQPGKLVSKPCIRIWMTGNKISEKS